MSATYSSASLYVGDLHPDVTETLLFEIFKQVGAVASIRVCRDAVTRRSLGYAYVNFHSVVDAERALESLNYSMIKSKPCRIMWSHRDPSIRKSGVGNVFIKNLDKQIDNKSFFEIFSPHGNILSCKVATDENGVSRGYGFVHYERQEEAEQAIQKCNNTPIHGKKIFVGHFIPKKEKREYVQKFTNVYIKNLDPSVDENELQQIFGVHGTITKAAIMRDENGVSKGFGFVNFSQPEEAKSAVEKVSGQEHKGKILFVARAQKKSEREAELRNKFEVLKQERMNQYQGVNLYIKNLDDTLDDEKLATQFSPFGTITSSKIMRDEKGNSRGFGFVCYTNPDEATKAVVEMNGRMIGSKPLYVALAQRRDVRRAQLEAQYRQAQGASTGAGPVFYPPGTTPPPGSRSPSFLYPQQMIPRAGWPGAQTPYQAIPNFVVPVSQRPARQGRQRNNPSQGGPPPGSGRSQTSQGRRGFKYTPNARNSPQAAAQNVHAPPMSQQEHIPPHGQENLLANLSNASPETSKQILGEHLFPAIAVQEPGLAGKITGMLLESMEVNELVQLIESSELLAEKIAEAKGVLSGESAV